MKTLHLDIPMCNILLSVMKHITPILFCLLLSACDGGLEPPPPTPIEYGFSGTVYFAQSSWPRADSLVSIWIFASRIYPLDSAKAYNGLLSYPQEIFVYPSMSRSLPFNLDSIQYSFRLRTGTYKYVGVIQQFNSDMATYGIRAFRVVGLYKDSINLSQPGIVVVNDTSQITGIDMHVDFNHPPPQPF
jgi:hypothetical protein